MSIQTNYQKTVTRNPQTAKVRWRAIIIGFALIPINCYWIIQKTGVWMGPPDTLSLFYNVIFILLLLTLISSILRRYLPRSALNQGELLIIYVMLSVATALEGIDLMQLIPPTLGHAYWYATPENEWQDLFWQYLPGWLVVSDKSVLRGYYEGESSLYTALNVKAWLYPVLWWSAFLMVLVFVMLCINVILRRQWTEHEKLTYPIIQLPLEMTKPGNGGGFLRNRFLLTGFALAGGIDFINGLHYIYPVVPFIPISRTGFGWWQTFDLGRFFTEKPFAAIGWTPVSVFPFGVGLAFLMPLDLSLSCWVFYLLRKVQLILGGMFGFQSLPQFPYIKPQSSGAYMGLCFIALYQGRRYLLSVLRKAFIGDESVDDSAEPMRYRWAVLGIICGVSVLLFFSFKVGMSIWVALAYFTIYFILAIAMTRMRAELGPPAHELEYGGPTEIITNFAGTRRLGPANLTISSLYMVFNRCYRCHPMPHQLEGFKLAEQTGIEKHKIVFAILVAALLGILSFFWASIHAGYHSTGNVMSWAPQIAFNRLKAWLYDPRGSDLPAAIFTSIGFALTLLLSFLRMRFIWWKLHPVGYPLCASWTMNLLWFSIFLGWAIKAAVLKYGGIKGYRKALPFFLGLILGEFVIGSVWNIIGQAFGITTYIFWH